MAEQSQPSQDGSMQLSLEELQWAHQIKEAIHNSEDLTRPVSDYECAQWAIVTMADQNVQGVLQRAYKYQCFRDELKLHGNSLEEGMRLMCGYLKLQPGNILTIEYLSTFSHFLFVFDYARFHPKAVQSVPDWRTFMGGMGYMLHLMTARLQSTREGIAMIGECEGMGFHNYDAQLEERFMNELFNYYPLKHKKSLWLRTPTVANIVFACLKPFLTAELKAQFHLGCQLEGYGERIDKLYQMPCPEIAQERLVQRLESYLQLRIDNQNNYVLPQPHYAEEDMSHHGELSDDEDDIMWDDDDEDGEEP